MSFPTGIDVSAGGTVYVTDDGQRTSCSCWTTGGVFSSSFDGSGGGNPAFGNPVDVSESAETGKVFVADDAGNSVEQFSSTGTYESRWDAAGSGDGQFSTPAGIATGTLDRFFVADLDNGRIQRFDAPLNSSVVRTSGTKLIFEARAGDANVVTISQSGSDLHGHGHRQHPRRRRRLHRDRRHRDLHRPRRRSPRSVPRRWTESIPSLSPAPPAPCSTAAPITTR